MSGAKAKLRRYVETLSHVSREFCVSIKTVESWRADGMPGEKGRWDLIAIAEWRVIRTLEGGTPGRKKGDLTGNTSDLEREYKVRKLKVEALWKEEEYALWRKDLIEKEEVHLRYVGRVIEMRKGIMSVHRHLHTLDPGFSRQEREAEVESALLTLLERYSSAGIPGVTDELVAGTLELIWGKTEPPTPPSRSKKSSPQEKSPKKKPAQNRKKGTSKRKPNSGKKGSTSSRRRS